MPSPPAVPHPVIILNSVQSGVEADRARVSEQPDVSVLLADVAWFAHTRHVIGHVGDIDTEICCGYQATYVDQYPLIINRRLNQHITRRVTDTRKHNSWVFAWVRDNISRVVAIAASKKHIAKRVVEDKRSMLKGNTDDFARVVGDLESGQGCYLYWVPEWETWVRSGKVGGNPDRTFKARHDEHAKAADLQTDDNWKSSFYRTFPNTGADLGGQEAKGSWGMLEQFVGLGFMNGDRETVSVLTSRETAKGLFVWSDSAMSHLEKLWDGQTVECKQLHMVGYLFELIYDLMLEQCENVSSSPGFESPLGIFGARVGTDM